MKPIEGVNLDDLINEVSKATLEERRVGAAGLIKQLLTRHEQLIEERKKAANELKKIEERIEKSTFRIEKLKQGDWSVLAEEPK